ncbi:MAG: FixH family protein [Cohaesibacter sp.]|nr:FixH family protein [Cohaesibacter sp.]MCV6602560.1 FixH family protein [Cohaesibacter sp.]
MANPAPKKQKELTGKHVLMWVLGFFGVMFIANGFFVYYANISWPGVEVESSYKEGQVYDQKLAEARAQQQRAWAIDAQLKRSAGDVILVVEAKDKQGNALTGLSIKAEVGRPITEAQDHKGDLSEKGDGLYTLSLGALDPGRWRVKLDAFEKDELKFKSVGQTTLE